MTSQSFQPPPDSTSAVINLDRDLARLALLECLLLLREVRQDSLPASLRALFFSLSQRLTFVLSHHPDLRLSSAELHQLHQYLPTLSRSLRRAPAQLREELSRGP